MRKVVLLNIVLLLLLSCGKNSKCLKSNGEDITQQRELNTHISNIILDDNIDLIITHDSIPNLNIYGGENLVDYVKTEINGTNLKISNENKCNFLRSYKNPLEVYISTNNLKYINYVGSGNIKSTNTLISDTLLIETIGIGSINLKVNTSVIELQQHSGAADFKISGNATHSYLYTHGNGWFDLEYCSSNISFINHKGTGDIIVNAQHEIYADIYHVGNIKYLGNPNIILTNNSGEGTITRK